MSRKRSGAMIAAATSPEALIFFLVIVALGFLAWYGKDWWAKLTAPFAFWWSVFKDQIFWALTSGKPGLAWDIFVGQLKGSMNAARGKITPPDGSKISVGVELDVSSLPLAKVPGIFFEG